MNYKIEQGDCLELMKSLPNSSVNMVLADLPYGILSTEDWDVCLPFNKLWKQYRRVIKDNGAIALFGQEPFSSQLRLSNLRWYRYDWIWEKSQAGGVMLSHNRPLRSYETISIFSKKQPAYHPPLENQDRFDTQKYPKDVLYFSNRRKESYHPAQKPVRLLEYLIETYTDEHDLILDNTMGSGSTGVAAVQTKRKFVGFELKEEYFQIAEKRIKEVAMSDMPYQKPRLLDTSLIKEPKAKKIPEWVYNL